MNRTEFKKLIREEIEKVLNEAPAPKKTVGEIIRSIPEITWKKGISVIYPNTRYSKTQKVVDYKVSYIGWEPSKEKLIQDKVYNELKKAGYPIQKDGVIMGKLAGESYIKFQVRFPIEPIELQ